MEDTSHPAFQFVEPLKDLAEGRLEPDAWLAWWTAHAAEVEAACPRGWFLKLKPTQLGSGANRAAAISQEGACRVLESLQVSFQRSDRYQRAWEADFDQFCAAQETRKQLRAEQYEPGLSSLGDSFPKFARFLKKRVGDIDRLEGPASESEIEMIEEGLGVPLPAVFKQFLRCTKALSLDALTLGLDQIRRHPALIDDPPSGKETICIGEYWLDADGDQVLLEYCTQPVRDPVVYYYGHSAGTRTARKLAATFSGWIEALPRSPALRE